MTKWLAFAFTIIGICFLQDSRAVSFSPQSDSAYAAIRENDLPRFRMLVSSAADASAKDEQADTPLHYAAGAGSLDAMKFLVEKGADVNAQNAFGSTPLMLSATDLAKIKFLVDHGANVNVASRQGRTVAFLAAMSDSSAEIVRYLSGKGADLKARDAFGNTILAAAASGDDLDTIKVLVDAGVDVNAVGATGMTPLVLSAYHRNLAAVKLLLAKGANVNAVAAKTGLFPVDDPKSGPISLYKVTALHAALPQGSPELVRTLLDAGANVNAKEGRNMTPLMLAVASNHQQRAVIRMLLARGADVGAKCSTGETAADWAAKLGAPAGLELLKVARPAVASPVASHTPSVDAKTAAERAMTLLESSSQKFFQGSNCVSCHHQNITDLAAAEMKAKGLKFDQGAAIERVKMLGANPPADLLYERMDIFVPEIFAQQLVSMAALGYPGNPATDALVSDIAASQSADGSWHVLNGIGGRPPAEEAYITRAALCVRALKAYASPARASEMNARIARAQKWLAATVPVTSEERNMKLLGLAWAGADAATLKPLAAAIAAGQRADGGWRQIDTLPSDAYATGQSLYALAKAGMAPTDPAFVKGVNFLLATQSENGSWRVTSRAPKFQAYFNSGFPYAGDQWISSWATGWAAMALAQAAPPLKRASN